MRDIVARASSPGEAHDAAIAHAQLLARHGVLPSQHTSILIEVCSRSGEVLHAFLPGGEEVEPVGSPLRNKNSLRAHATAARGQGDAR